MTEMERIARKYGIAHVEPIADGVQKIDATERIEAALREFGELACKAVCRLCSCNQPLWGGGKYHLKSGERVECQASAIRKLMATEIERG